jgi:DNA replication and repair protein RecF
VERDALTASLTLDRVSIRHLRNLTEVDAEFGPRFNVIAGDNGQGKTNLLDAVYTLATSKSFRSSKPEDVLQHGQDVASVRGVFTESGLSREQSVGQQRGLRAVRIEGKRPKTLIEYASRTPVVVFHPGDTALPAGSGSERRRLLDRIALHQAPGALVDLDRYTRASRERQRAMDERGASAKDLGEWESLMITHGLGVRRARADAASRLSEAATRVFTKVAVEGATLTVAYEPGAPEDPLEYAAALVKARPVDARRGSAKVGPHRDDLGLVLGGQRVRGIASQGQQRLVVLALKAAEIEVIEGIKGVRPLLLLDDVSSELDRARTAALFAFVGRQEGQIFLTTTRPELIDTSSSRAEERRDYVVVGGTLKVA